MRVMFVSDIHGSLYYASKLKKIYLKEQPDSIILLGDLYYHGPRNELSKDYDPMEVADVLSSIKNNLTVIKGNCDAEVDEAISDFLFFNKFCIDISGKRFFCTHGHKINYSNLPVEEFDVMAYGHTHNGFIKRIDNHLFINPGSISLPRGGSVNSYIIIDDSIIYLKDLDGNIIDKFDMEDL